MTLAEMNAQRDTLLAARYRGVRTVEIDGRRIAYARAAAWIAGADRWTEAMWRATSNNRLACPKSRMKSKRKSPRWYLPVSLAFSDEDRSNVAGACFGRAI